MAETLDPEVWTNIMNEAFKQLIEAVERFEGTVARLMGDGILAIFGAPTAHEDDPERAVLAGLAMINNIGPLRERLQREQELDFNIRVGVNTGLVVVGDVGSDKVSRVHSHGRCRQPGGAHGAGRQTRHGANLRQYLPANRAPVRR